MRVKDGLNNKLYPKVFAGIAACKLCKLSKIRHQVVVGDGSIKSSIVIIGEAPGREEDEQGSPFIGRSGKLLRRLMKRAGFDAKPVYITNIVKCRPPNNRTPTNTEVKACSINLELQLRVIRPDTIVTVDNTALNYFRPKLHIMQPRSEIPSWSTLFW